MTTINFGIIGVGNASFFHILGQKQEKNPIIQFTAAYDPDDKNLKKAIKRLPVTPFSDFNAFLKSDLFDAVLILVPHYLHASIAKAAAAAGKHILCEKPMANTPEECDEMITAAKSANVKLMIAENHRFLPVHRYMKESIQSGLLGDIYWGRTYEGAYDRPENFLNPESWHFTWDKGGGGVTMDQGVHKFALLNWLLGPVESAQAWLTKVLPSPPNKGEDNAVILLRYKSGAFVEVALSSTSLHPINNTTELLGTLGHILEDHASIPPVKVYSSHPKAFKQNEYYSPSDIEHGAYPMYYNISARIEDTYFGHCLQTNTEPEFTPIEAKNAVMITFLSYLSVQKNRPVSMAELTEVITQKGSKSILDGLISKIYHVPHSTT